MERAVIIGKNIAKIRKQKHITQEELSLKTGWTRVHISRYENGEIKRINYEFLTEISKVLDVTIEELEDSKNVKE